MTRIHQLRAAQLWGAVFLALALVLVAIPRSQQSVLAQVPVAEADATLGFVHGAPGAPAIDILVDGLPIMEGLSFGAVTDYVTVTPGEHRFQIVSEDQPPAAALVNEVLDVAPGAAYILAPYGRLNDIGGTIFPVDLSEIEPGESRVRLINLSTDIDNLDLLETGGDEWFGDVGLGQASAYRILPRGAYTMDVRGDNDRVLQTLTDLTFQDTRVYDVVVLGQIFDDSLTLKAFVTRVSPPCARVLGIPGSNSDVCLRLVHASPDAPPIDAYLNDARISEGLDFGTVTTYVAAPSGEGRGLRVVATGSPVEQAAIDTQLGLEPGQAYELIVTGSGDALDLTITGTGLRPVPAGQARLRVVHASPDLGSIDIGIPPLSTIFGGVNFREATNYVVIDAGAHPIEVRPAGDDLTVRLRTNAMIEEAVSYDLIVLGRPSNRSLRFLALRAPLAVREGSVATPVVVTADAAAAETLVPRGIGTAPATPLSG